jgi:hypothetical protein
MGESIGQPASKAGVDGAVVETTVGKMRSFVGSEGRSDKVAALIDRIPGTAAANSGSGRSRLTVVGTGPTAVGVGMGEIQRIAPELLRDSLDKIGAHRMGEIITGTPGLGQFA